MPGLALGRVGAGVGRQLHRKAQHCSVVHSFLQMRRSGPPASGRSPSPPASAGASRATGASLVGGGVRSPALPPGAAAAATGRPGVAPGAGRSAGATGPVPALPPLPVPPVPPPVPATGASPEPAVLDEPPVPPPPVPAVAAPAAGAAAAHAAGPLGRGGGRGLTCLACRRPPADTTRTAGARTGACRERVVRWRSGRPASRCREAKLQPIGGRYRSAQSTAALTSLAPSSVAAAGRCQKRPTRFPGALNPLAMVPPFS